MKLGVFDSGLGGVQIAKAIRGSLPDVDIVYLGDTLHVPYGKRSEAAIYDYTKRCIDYMFGKQNCQLIIMACNTASASALRKLQQSYLPEKYPERRVLGVVVPTIEYALDRGYTNLGLIGTSYTVHSKIYEEELQKINPDIRIHQVQTPLLVPLIENDGMEWVESVLDRYMEPLVAQNIEALILSCTHYICLKDILRSRYEIDVISQDEIVPVKLEDYLVRHPETEGLLTRTGQTQFFVTDLTDDYAQKTSEFYGQNISLQQVELGEIIYE